MTTTTYEREARSIGADHGRAAASWVDLTEADAEAIDREGVWENLEPGAPLSGEWADGYSVDALLHDVGATDLEDYSTEDGDYGRAQDLADAYEDAYWQAFEAEVLRQVENLRGPTLDLDEDTAYLVGAGTVAWRYVGQTFGGRARLVMVGDDRVFTFDADEVRPASGYCIECGQTGCYGGIRNDDDEEDQS